MYLGLQIAAGDRDLWQGILRMLREQQHYQKMASLLDYHLRDITWSWVQFYNRAKLKQIKLTWAPRLIQPKMGFQENVL